MQKLDRSFYEQNTVDVARGLLGKLLVRYTSNHFKIGKIVETEAYLGSHDKACHSFKGRTKRTEVMFNKAGYAYVYLIYGMYNCFNVVTEQEGVGSAVLIRALEPIENINARTQGPGLLTRAMDIDKTVNGHDLLSDDLFIGYEKNLATNMIIATPRIGVNYAQEWSQKLLRFHIKDNQYISGAKK